MRILVLQESNWIERGPHQQHHLMDRMSLRGHDIHVIDYDILWRIKKNRKIIKRREDFGNQPKIFPNAKVHVVRPATIQLPVLEYFSLAFTHWMEIRREIRDFKPDVIVSFGILNAYIGARLAERHRIPHVYYLIDHLHTLLPLKAVRPFARYFEGQTMVHSKKITVINQGLAEYCTDMQGVGDIEVIPGGVDLELYQNACNKRGKIRSELGFDVGDTVLFFMGWLYNFSGIREVALEFAKKRSRHPIKMLIVGEGDALPSLLKIRDNYDLKNQLVLMGKQPYARIPELLSAADICLLPADPSEPTMRNIVPIKLYEYMAEGKPVIATKLPGILKEFGKNNGVIYVERPEDVIETAEDMITKGIIKDEGEKAKNFVKNNDWEKIADDFENLLQRIT